MLVGWLCGCMLVATTHDADGGQMGKEMRESLVHRREALMEERVQLQRDVGALEDTLARYSSRADGEKSGALRVQWLDLRRYAGLTDVAGPGVEIVLNDAPRDAICPGEDVNLYIVHDVDVLRVVNLLRGAGAEAISINGERLLANSRIRCGGPTIRVRDKPLAPPFVLHAIGDPARLYGALTAPGEGGSMSELEILRFFGVRADISRMDTIEVPRYAGKLEYRYAEAAG